MGELSLPAVMCWDSNRVIDWADEVSGDAVAVFLWAAGLQGRCGNLRDPRARSFKLSEMDISIMNDILLEIQ